MQLSPQRLTNPTTTADELARRASAATDGRSVRDPPAAVTRGARADGRGKLLNVCAHLASRARRGVITSPGSKLGHSKHYLSLMLGYLHEDLRTVLTCDG